MRPRPGLTLEDEKPFRPTSEMLAALTERYSNIAIGNILDVSKAAVRMMLKRAGIKRANRVLSSLDDWQAAIIRAELKAEMARKEKPNGTVIAG
jgi:radical SAM superfamily enzyme with C-terminal helix-hairpin-helix motif